MILIIPPDAEPSAPAPASTPAPHPCLRCGACCASFRVAFYWAETSPPSADGIPQELTAKLDPLRVAMRGTDQAQPRCVALRGGIGVDAHCAEYARRPSPCRELKPAWEDGLPSPQCDRARQRHGLAPLTAMDWIEWRSATAARVEAGETPALEPRTGQTKFTGGLAQPGSTTPGGTQLPN